MVGFLASKPCIVSGFLHVAVSRAGCRSLFPCMRAPATDGEAQRCVPGAFVTNSCSSELNVPVCPSCSCHALGHRDRVAALLHHAASIVSQQGKAVATNHPRRGPGPGPQDPRIKPRAGAGATPNRRPQLRQRSAERTRPGPGGRPARPRDRSEARRRRSDRERQIDTPTAPNPTATNHITTTISSSSQRQHPREAATPEHAGSSTQR